MSKTLLRGLGLIELVGLHGPLTVTEIARRTGTDLSIVSRTVAACEPDGWLLRASGKVLVGPRCALLGLTSPASGAIRRAEPLVRAIAAAAGVTASASALVGREVMIIAAATAGTTPALIAGVPSRVPVHLMADGRAIAAQLDPGTLAGVLPAEPYPTAEQLIASLDTGSVLPEFVAALPRADAGENRGPATRAELDAMLAGIRSEGFCRDTGQVNSRIHCISRPWPAAGLPSAITCIGGRDEISERRAIIEACLAAATDPGATAQDVVRAAAGALSA
jgi:DNA-binding IclR family transcriptional regulator